MKKRLRPPDQIAAVTGKDAAALTGASGMAKHRLAMKRFATAFSILLIAGLVGFLNAAESPAPDTSLCGPYPKLYKEIIWNWMQGALVDASSAKIEWEGEPKCTDVGKDGQHLYGWLVNFKVNSRNRFGAYTGKQSHGAVLRDGQIIKTIGFGY